MIECRTESQGVKEKLKAIYEKIFPRSQQEYNERMKKYRHFGFFILTSLGVIVFDKHILDAGDSVINNI